MSLNPNIVCEPLNGFFGVSVGGLATLNLNLGRRYHKLVLTGDGTAGAPYGVNEFEYIKLKINGKEFYNLTPAEIHALNKLHGCGNYQNPKDLVIYFEQPWAETPALEDALCIGTGPGVQLFTIEIKVKSGLAKAPEIKGYQFYDLARQTVTENGTTYETALPLGEFKQILTYTKEFSAQAGGTHCYDVPVRGLLQALHFDTDKISEVEVFLGTTSIYHIKDKEFSRINNLHDMTDDGKWTHVMINQGRIKSGIVNAESTNFKIRVVADEAISPKCLVECVVYNL